MPRGELSCSNSSASTLPHEQISRARLCSLLQYARCHDCHHLASDRTVQLSKGMVPPSKCCLFGPVRAGKVRSGEHAEPGCRIIDLPQANAKPIAPKSQIPVTVIELTLHLAFATIAAQTPKGNSNGKHAGTLCNGAALPDSSIHAHAQ